MVEEDGACVICAALQPVDEDLVQWQLVVEAPFLGLFLLILPPSLQGQHDLQVTQNLPMPLRAWHPAASGYRRSAQLS